MPCASFRVMLLFLDRSLITNCYVYLCNSCNVVSYKAVTVVFLGLYFLNVEEIESQQTDSSKFNRPIQLGTNPWQTVQLPDRFLNLFTHR